MKIEFEVDIRRRKCVINGVSYDVIGENAMLGIGHLLNDYLYRRNNALNGTFNKAVFWPMEVEAAVAWALSRPYIVEATVHASERIAENHLPPNCYTAMLYGEVVEAEFAHGLVTKVVTRLPNRKDYSQDICAAIKLVRNKEDSDTARVTTVWVNHRNDAHFTLKKENYVHELT